MKRRAGRILFVVSFIIFCFSLLIFLISRTSPTVATHLNTTLSQYVRNTLCYITSPIEYSFFEGILLAIVPIIVLSLIYISSKASPHGRFLICLCPMLLTASIYFLTLGISYSAEPLYSDFITPRQDLSKGDFYVSAKKLVAVINENAENSSRTYTASEIEASARELFFKRSLLPILSPKKSAFSPLLTRVGIVSFYSFITGEIIINSSLPTYMTPFVLAHEYAHSIGASSEADAEICAYLILAECDNSFLNYSAAISALEYIYPFLSSSERQEIYSALPEVALSDFSEYKRFLSEYSSTSSEAFDALNEAHSAIYGREEDYSFTAILIASLISPE